MKRAVDRQTSRLIELSGLVLLCLSLFLAYHLRYNHFYEVLLAGLFLVLYGLNRGHKLFPRPVRTYLLFVLMGLVIDALIGVNILHAWHYNNYRPSDYALNYLVVYPLFGSTVVQMYFYFGKRLRPHQNKFTRPCVLSDFYSYPLRTLLILISVALASTFISEVPNISAESWSYSGFLLGMGSIADIPVLSLAGWPILVLIPLSAYQIFLKDNKRHSLGPRKFFPAVGATKR
ncbi:MAG TPA: hypothetical protein VFW90_00850 [Candidatus Saccharimonadales bacterium]|nr:hypothetical protein [Candidatus Saccharimonadales bacterium]